MTENCDRGSKEISSRQKLGYSMDGIVDEWFKLLMNINEIC